MPEALSKLNVKIIQITRIEITLSLYFEVLILVIINSRPTLINTIYCIPSTKNLYFFIYSRTNCSHFHIIS